MRGDTADGARRDERRVVVEPDEHIGWAGGDRQRGDNRADRSAGALGHHRRGDDEAGGDRHLENE